MKKSTTQILIENLSNERYEYIKVWQESWNEEAGHYTSEENPKIDELSDQILDLIKTGKWDLSFEFIIEELTKLGWAPCLLYDDDGHFAITGGGMQSIGTENSNDIALIHWIPAEEWKDSIREALDYYLENE